MKQFFAKASKPFASVKSGKSEPPAASPVSASSNAEHVAGPGLQPKDILPAAPHPHPYDHLAILATQDGLLIRPHIAQPSSYIQLAWGKVIKVHAINQPDKDQSRWQDCAIVYGIVGILELFSGSYLLVISSRSEVGSLLNQHHLVYGVKTVIAIPLVEDRARVILKTLSARNAITSRPSLRPSTTLGTVAPSESIDLDDRDSQYAELPDAGSLRVQFSSTDDIRVMTPLNAQSPDGHQGLHMQRPSSPFSSSSEASFSSENSISTSPVEKTLASRLSFWSRLSKRGASGVPPQVESEAHEAPITLVDAQPTLEEMIRTGTEAPSKIIDTILATTAPAPSSTEERHSELEDKIVRECVREFSKGGMYFAYNFDITRSLQHKQEQVVKAQRQHVLLADLNALPIPKRKHKTGATTPSSFRCPTDEPYPTLPLWRRVDRQFWWNEWLSKPFVEAGLHSYVLPIMQGYCQIAHFDIPPDATSHDDDATIEYVIISRRSRDRAGLRYQRRGIDEDAHVANFVETETIMRVERGGAENIFSYVQIRGSIPLFWTQTGYGLKPAPLLASDRTPEQNLDAIRRHFQRTIPHYGPHAVINLAEQHGKEAAITQGYKKYMQDLNSKEALYYEYDFHTETRGMKYENISKLVNIMERTFDTQGYLWISGNNVLSQQKGVFRVNCIDCLDRTNVVQSAFARYVLKKQLGAVALLNPPIEGRSETDVVFNDVWANNGDAISRAYAGTSALKGDFTRTGKRDLSGLLNDGVNSLARMYTSTFSDWFCQAVIDFMLGNRTLSVFSEFLLKLQSTDPRDLIRLSKIRAEAIATSVSRVLPEGERLQSGWTLFAPEELNTRVGEKFEEKLLLLTAKALYVVSYDYTLEKVKLYTRVPLGDITQISKGAYILSPLEETSRDPIQNAGFVVSWHNSNQTTRVTSYSLRNTLDRTTLDIPATPATPAQPSPPSPRQTRNNTSPRSRHRTGTALSQILANTSVPGDRNTFAAFKVLPIDPARVRMASNGGGAVYTEAVAADELSAAESCQKAVEMIVASIEGACADIGGAQGKFVIDEDVVSLAEAQRMTSMYAKMEYGVKRLLWLGG